MNKKYFILTVFSLAFVFGFSLVALASVGVGVRVSSIKFDQPLEAGKTYDLPVVPVYNSGDIAGDYAIHIEYQTDQTALRPAKEWFVFTPEFYHLEPGQTKDISTKLTIPKGAEGGDYFAYLNAHPSTSFGTHDTANIGVAAGVKFYFTVKGEETGGILGGLQSYKLTFSAVGLFLGAIVIMMLGFFLGKKTQ
jgi:hypothetical protein